MSAPPAQRNLVTLSAGDGAFRYQIQASDLLWLAKMVRYEGDVDSAPALLWTLASRYVWIDRTRYPTLAALARNFSQPINPIWARGGSMCRAGGQYHGSDWCSESRLKTRERAVAETWRSLPVAVTDIVAAWATGRVTNPVPTAANWAAGQVATNYLAKHVGTAKILTYAGNTFIAEVKTKAWPDDHVALINRDGSVTTTVLTPAPFFASLARGIGRGLSVV
jgi:hypothetical protein